MENENDTKSAAEAAFQEAANKRAAREAQLSEEQRARYQALRLKQDADLKRGEQHLAQRRRDYETEIRKHGIVPRLDMISIDRTMPRALRDAAREYASQDQWIARLKKAQERECDRFFANEDSFARAAEKRAVLEARLPEQYRTQYLDFCQKLDAQKNRQERRLAQRREEYIAEQRKIGVTDTTLDIYPLEIPAPRSLRVAALNYLDQEKQLRQLRITIEDGRHGFLTRAIAGDPDPSRPPSRAVLQEIMPRMLALDDELGPRLRTH